MDTKGPRMLAGNFAPDARLRQHRKDVDLILDAAERSRARTPLSHMHRELLRELEERGYADADNSAIIRAFDGVSDDEAV
jgi:3-hydroxyisobutyrate dehydrogenase-like beta-hydroxyacid dehydrogenase